jgi:transcription elongation factor Elf1
MDRQRNDLLAEMAGDAALERSDFLVRSGEQLDRFLSGQSARIRELGGLTLIDDDPDYLAIAPDGSFRSRTRSYDDVTGAWQSETEVIENAGELVELYNPADIYQAFVDAAREGALAGGEEGAGEADEEGGSRRGQPFLEDPYAGAADSWAAGQPEVPRASDAEGAATALYELALDFQERSQLAESGLIEQFENAAASLLGRVGVVILVDDLDEHLELALEGFRGRVIPEGETDWTDLDRPEEVVRFYDPTDVFGDLADAIADLFPGVAGDDDDEDDAEGANGDDGKA